MHDDEHIMNPVTVSVTVNMALTMYVLVIMILAPHRVSVILALLLPLRDFTIPGATEVAFLSWSSP